MARQFIVVTKACNLDVEVINVAHIVRICKTSDDCAELTVSFGFKKVYCVKVCESVQEILEQLENK